MNKKTVSIILGVMCLLLTYGICIQIKTINRTNSTISTNSEQNNLRDEVLKYKEKYDNKYAELEKAEELLEKEREKVTKNNTELTQMEEEIKAGNKILGLTDVTGPGVIVTLKDNQTVSSNSVLNASDYIVHDEDVLNVINELKNAGAEAISINDQRLVPTSGIICAGNIIEVNGEKVGAPFEIKAIGLPEQLAGLERLGGYLDYLKDYVEVDLKKSNNITIPKYTGVISFKYAENLK